MKIFFDRVFTITGQTYSRKQDYDIMCALGGLGASVHKVRERVNMHPCIIINILDLY